MSMVSAELIEVIKVVTTRGGGESEDDPIRRIEVYFDKEGNFLAENDPGVDDYAITV